MSNQPAIPFSPTLVPGPGLGRTRSRVSIAGLSINGILVFLASLLVMGSGFANMRPEVMGLAVHPYLFPVVVAFPFVVVTRITEFPLRVLVMLLVFSGMYFVSVFNGSSFMLSEVFKVASAVVTIVTCALLVRRRGDFVAGALGLSIGVTILALRALQEDPRQGLEVMAGVANKNSYSLFALPAILLSGFIALHMKETHLVFKSILIGTTLPTLAAIFMSGNRSGYLGAVVVGLMLFWNRRGKGFLLVAAVVAAVMIWVVEFGSTAAFDDRMKVTMEGKTSDSLRREIFFTCVLIGLENPIIGVSPQVLPWEISRNVKAMHHGNVLDSHNVFGHIIGSSGLICSAALLGVGWTMWNWRPRNGGKLGDKDDPLRVAVKLLRMMIFLWVVRGTFSREILYNPSFTIGFGLAIGLCMLAETARSAAKNPSLAMPPAGLGAIPRSAMST